MSTSPGVEFAQALAAKDFERAKAVLDPAVSFRGLTPNMNWDANSPEAVVNEILVEWFEPDDHIEELVSLEEGPPVADRSHISYRFRGHNPDGPFVMEQQAYYSVSEEGRINWMRVLCSGNRPPDA